MYSPRQFQSVSDQQPLVFNSPIHIAASHPGNFNQLIPLLQQNPALANALAHEHGPTEFSEHGPHRLPDICNLTPLHVTHSPEAVRVLLAADADIFAEDSKKRSVWEAQMMSPQIIKILYVHNGNRFPDHFRRHIDTEIMLMNSHKKSYPGIICSAESSLLAIKNLLENGLPPEVIQEETDKLALAKQQLDTPVVLSALKLAR